MEQQLAVLGTIRFIENVPPLDVPLARSYVQKEGPFWSRDAHGIWSVCHLPLSLLQGWAKESDPSWVNSACEFSLKADWLCKGQQIYPAAAKVGNSNMGLFFAGACISEKVHCPLFWFPFCHCTKWSNRDGISEVHNGRWRHQIASQVLYNLL